VANINKPLSRKELKQPDQFVSFWTRFSSQAGAFLSARRKPALISVGVLAGVVTATLIYGEMSERASIRASLALARVEKIASADLLPAESGGGAEAKPEPKDDGLPHFKTDKERLAAALQEVDAFLTAEPRSPLRREAQLQKAGILLDLQRPGDAIPIYADLLSSRLDKNLRFMAEEGLGYGYEAKGDLDQAQAAFARLGEAAGGKSEAKSETKSEAKSDDRSDALTSAPFYRDRALYHQARIAERKGNPAEAVKLYKEVLDKAPQSSLRDEISNRLAVLEPK
jgi:tetratricopeptide (TPR) repeat protein